MLATPSSTGRGPAGRAGSARPQYERTLPPSLPIEPLLDLPAELQGDPPAITVCPEGTPPDAFDFPGAKRTKLGWVYRCPCCSRGVVILRPTGQPYTYTIYAQASCSGEQCPPELILWWQELHCGRLPGLVGEPDERARRYASAVLRRVLADMPERPSAVDLKRSAFKAGQWIEASGVVVDQLAHSIMTAARRSGLGHLAGDLGDALTAGRAKPGRIPR
jgi:hypothetical protein